MSHCDPEGLSLLALGESAATANVDTSHLASCSLCQGQLDGLAAVVATARSVRRDDAPAAPPAAVWDSIAEELQLADRSAPSEDADPAPPWPTSFRSIGALVAVPLGSRSPLPLSSACLVAQ